MIKVILSTSIIFLVIVAIRKFFREKAGNVFLYSLWLLFAAGLILPVFSVALQDITGGERGRIESPVSVMNFVKTTSLNTDKTDMPAQAKKEIAEQGKEIEKQTTDTGKQTEKQNVTGSKTLKETSGSNEYLGQMKLLPLKYLLFFIWSVGTITILLYQLLLEKSFRRQLTENREEINYQGQKAYIAKGIQTPLLFRGKGLSTDIYLPETIMQNETLMKHAIRHENIHRKHGDIWWGYLRNFLLAVYWFYPLVWFAAILSKRDCEYACDSSVMRGMSKEERISYGNSLLSLIQLAKNRDLFCTATAMKIGKSEMEVRIRMIKKEKKRNIFVTAFIILLIFTVGTIAFTDAMETEKKTTKEKIISPKQQEQKETLSAKEAEFELTDFWGADVPDIYYEDNTNLVFAAYFGLFVYSKKTEEIVQSLDLHEIGCDSTQGDQYCEINVSEDGKTAYLHVIHDTKMYQYSIDTQELQHLDYKLPDNLYNRKKYEKTHSSGIQCIGATIGDVVYWNGDGANIIYQPLFYKPYGSCDFFKPEDIRNLSEVSFYANGKEYVITEKKKLKWIEKHFSDSVEKIKGASACPFYHIMYLKRKDGNCGKIFPATDSCSIYQSANSFYDYKEKTNEAFWKLFGIKDMDMIK